MEIRKNMNFSTEETEPVEPKKPQEEGSSRPVSPCDSEISVGCEAKECPELENSPMDLTDDSRIEENEKVRENGENFHLPSISRASSRSPKSPHSSSSSSIRDEPDSLSEDEYFRPLKRLAMCESSPQYTAHARLSETITSPQHSISVKHRLSEATTSSPEPIPLPPSSLPQLRPSESLQSPASNKDLSRLQENQEDEEDESIENRSELEEHRENAAVLPDDQKLCGLRSFSILDILSYKPSKRKSSIPVKIVRPWDTREDTSKTKNSTTTHSQITKGSKCNNNNNTSNPKKQGSQNNDRGSALDALFKMTNKTLDNLNKEDKADAVNLFNNRQPTKKKRKSRTAFTNNQIFELEKRFLYQKYLSPADRDELAQSLGLSNAQVITWFQNRRAKLKRDMEELKRDVECTKSIPSKALLEASANVVAFLKAKDLPKIHLAALHH